MSSSLLLRLSNLLIPRGDENLRAVKGLSGVRNQRGTSSSLALGVVGVALLGGGLVGVCSFLQPFGSPSLPDLDFQEIKVSKKSRCAQSESSKLAAEAVSNLRTIAAFSSQDHILRLFDKSQEGPRKESIRQSWFAGLVLSTSMCLMTCTWALNFWYGGKLIAERHITAKALMQTFMIVVTTGRMIGEASSMTSDLAKGADAMASVFAVLDRETEIDPDSPDGYKAEKLKGEVEIQGVDFAYPSRPAVIVLKGFSLSIQAGKSTALVGQSGSGKSTIIGLIERFYDPLRGIVKIDGRDIQTYNLRGLRWHIGLVSQDPTLFAGTIRENIMYGMEMASEAEIENAARSANAHDFISSLKEGYDTCVGERGLQLSGGQKQRIAIARAMGSLGNILWVGQSAEWRQPAALRRLHDSKVPLF
ncbi:hypothetical protein QOZ80_2AG0133750 [Eleusine coracana subsp. coracana]|nr:hypothetical protein QOZ80_2AG0133750 [Eleusine coracana subsp. coracana]